MTIADTSITAYKETNLTRERMCQQLMKLYEHGNYSDREAKYRLQWEACSEVSARRNDLGSIIMEKGRKKCQYTGKTVKVWGLYHEPQQLTLSL